MYKKICERDTYIVSVVIAKPEASDGGQWRCNAFNPHGDSNANISLNFESEYLSFPPALLSTFIQPPSLGVDSSTHWLIFFFIILFPAVLFILVLLSKFSCLSSFLSFSLTQSVPVLFAYVSPLLFLLWSRSYVCWFLFPCARLSLFSMTSSLSSSSSLRPRVKVHVTVAMSVFYCHCPFWMLLSCPLSFCPLSLLLLSSVLVSLSFSSVSVFLSLCCPSATVLCPYRFGSPVFSPLVLSLILTVRCSVTPCPAVTHLSISIVTVLS